MKTCPICNQELQSACCPDCGFDQSCDFESHPTLQPIGADVASIAARKARQTDDNDLRCPKCRQGVFRYRLTDQVFQCCQCKAAFTVNQFLEMAAYQRISPQYFTPVNVCRELLCAGSSHSVLLQSDGTVTAIGSNDAGQCNVRGWTNIVSVAAGARFTIGLRKDGTVVSAGRHWEGSVGTWHNVAAIAAAYGHALGLRSDGSVLATGQNRYHQCDVAGWTNITAVAAGGYNSVGLQADGTVLAVGSIVSSTTSQSQLSQWRGITAVAAGFSHIVGLRHDGTVVAVGANNDGECNVSHWMDIIAITAGYGHTVGLRKDGTIVTAGRNLYSPYKSVQLQWKNVIAIASGPHHTIGLCTDRSLVAFGSNYDGQCNVTGLTI